MSYQGLFSGAVKIRSLNGIVTATDGVIDAVAKIDRSQLPDSTMELINFWNASTNTPHLQNGTGNSGDVYKCNFAGVANFGGVDINFQAGDLVMYDGFVWDKIASNLAVSNYARNVYSFTATTGQTVYTFPYIPNQVDVFYNGSRITPSQYTALSGVSVTLLFTPIAGDILTFNAYISANELAGGGTTGYLTKWLSTSTLTDAVAGTDYVVPSTLSNYVPTSRTLTINGTTYDLTANRSWTIAAGVVSITASSPLFSSGGANPNLTIQQSSALQNGYLSSVDWSTFNAKQSALTIGNLTSSDVTVSGGTGAVIGTGTTLTLATVNATTGVFGSSTAIPVVTVNGKGLITNISTVAVSIPSGSLSFIGDVTGTGTTGSNTTLTLATVNTNVYASNTFLKFAVNGKGLITSAATVGNTDITSALGYTPYNATNPSGYISGITGTQVVTALGYTPEDIANKATSTSLGTSNTLYPTQNAVKTYVDSAVAGAVVLQGDWNASTNTPNISGTTVTGWGWRVSVAGTTNIGGITDWQVGDLVVKTAAGWIKIDNTDAVTSVFGRYGAIAAQSGDYNTSQVTESINLYYTDTRARAALSAGAGISYAPLTGVITSTITQYTDALARASVSLTVTGNNGASTYNSTTGVFNVPNYTLSGLGGEPIITAGTTLQYWRGDKTWQILDTSVVTENSNLYFTTSRARSSISAGTGISYSSSTGVISSNITQYTDALARAAISLTTTGSSGAATYSSSTGVLNIPTYTLTGLGGISLTSLSANSPLSYNNTTGAFSISQSNTTTNGYLSSTDWNTFNNKQSSLNGTGFVKASGTTISYDNSTYLTTSSASSTYVPYTGATSNVNLGSYSLTLNSEQFNSISAPTYAEGLVWYDTNQKSLAYYNDISGNILHIGQEVQLKVYNNTGSTIAKGAPVYVTSTSSGFSYPNVALAKADTLTTAAVIGLANQAIPTGTAGYITLSGLLSGANTGSFSVGDTLYLSPYSAGQLMNTIPPTGYAIKIGVVSYSNTPNGTIYINQSNAYSSAANIVGTIAISQGGTGATTASGARTNLGLGTAALNNTSDFYLSTNPSAYISLASLSAITPLSYNNSTGVFSISQSTTSTNGYLSSTDWNTFNNKQSTLTLTTTGSSGASTLVTNTLNIPTYTISGLGGVPTTRTLTINGTALDLSADRSWTIPSANAARNIQKFTATAGQTVFTVSGGYTPGMVDVYVNGIKLDNATDFTATNGSTITLTAGAIVNDIVEVYNYISAFTASNSLRQVTSFTATAGQNTFTVNYSIGFVDVFYNGSKLAASEYSAITGTTIVFNTNCQVGDIVEVIAYSYAVGAFTGIGGSGTANYLPKFNGTSTTIGNSSIYQGAAGFVSIGNTNSTYNLDVTGTGRFSSTLTLGTTAPPSYGSGSTGLNLGILNIQNVVGLQGAFSNNTFYNGTNWIYSSTAIANAVRLLANGDIQFHSSISGTAGATLPNWDTTDIKMKLAAGGILTLRGDRQFIIDTGVTNDAGMFIKSEGTNTTGFTNIQAFHSSVGYNSKIILQNLGGSVGVGSSVIVSPGGPSSLMSCYNTSTNNGNWALGLQSDATTNTTARGLGIKFSTDFNNGANEALYFIGGGTARFYVSSNGGIYNFSANNSNLSDERTKKDINPLESYWNKFKVLEIVKFKYKDQTHDDYNIGVIAQQVESIAPEFVNVDGFGEIPEDGIPLKSIYESDLHHATIKVLQECMIKIEEQQILITELRTELDAIKAKI